MNSLKKTLNNFMKIFINYSKTNNIFLNYFITNFLFIIYLKNYIKHMIEKNANIK